MRKIDKFLIPVKNYFIFVITNSTDTIDETFMECWNRSMPNVIVLMPTNNHSLSISTYFVFKDDCYSLTPHTFGIVNKESAKIDFSFDEVFPNKLKNFRGCRVYAATTENPPYVIINATGHVTGVNDYILQIIAKEYNFNVIYIKTNIDQFGISKPDNLHIFKLLTNNTVNLSISAIPQTPQLVKNFTASKCYSIELYTLAIPGPIDGKTPIEKLLLPFSLSVWLATTFYLFCAIIVIVLTKLLNRQWRHFIIGGRRNRSPIINLLNALLGGSVANPMMARNLKFFGTFARTLMMIWILSSLILRNSYQGALFNYLQGPQLTLQYDTIKKIIDSDITIYGRSYIGKDPIPRSRIQIYVDDLQTILQKIYNDEINGAVTCTYSSIYYFNAKRSKIEKLHSTIDSLHTMYLSLFFRKQTIFEDLVNLKICELYESGVLDWIYNQYLEEKTNFVYRKSASKIDFYTVSGIYQIGFILMCFNIFVFVLEIISQWSIFVRKILDFINY